jgi:hypothetical protein
MTLFTNQTAAMECLREANVVSPAPLAASATLPSAPEKITVPYGTVLCRAADGIVDFGPMEGRDSFAQDGRTQIVAAGPVVDVSPCSSMACATSPAEWIEVDCFFKEGMMRVCCDALFSAGRVCVSLFAVPPQGLKSFL